MRDKEIEKLIASEEKRQTETIDLIASENIVSRDVREALGSVFTNKYAEGYPKARFYKGNENADAVELLAGRRALRLFRLNPRTWSVNAQAYSGSPANLAVYCALVPQGERIMGMRLDMGGHLTHGHRVSITGKWWEQIPYGVDQKTEQLDYGDIADLARREKPRLIVAGYTAYPRVIDFKRLRDIARNAGALLMVDASHIAGLVAGGAYPSPFPYADVVTMTTHKTLRGPRAALIFARSEFAEAIHKTVFPGLQGGPHMNAIAAIAVALKEASERSFGTYARQIVKNARALSLELQRCGLRIVSGGTDTHLLLVDTWKNGVGGEAASTNLESIGIVTNKNAIPFDSRKPADPSGIRLGTPSVTTRGMKENEMIQLARLIAAGIEKRGRSETMRLRKAVERLARAFPAFAKKKAR